MGIFTRYRLSLYILTFAKMVACLCQFIMAMALHPEVQKRVQKEIDDVVGRDRLHTFQDRESLPYMECVFKESLRWGTPAPLCEICFSLF